MNVFEPGTATREYAVDLKLRNNWRVTDPNAPHAGAKAFLPNPVLAMYLPDLSGATGAELLNDRWGGHPGTVDKRIRFNGNDWIDLPELTTTPEGHHPTCFMSEDNPVVPIPLNHLKRGDNTFEGTCGDQICHSFGWGQWGWYGAILRVFVDAEREDKVRIVSPLNGDSFGENPVVRIDGTKLNRVDLFAHYHGVDHDGDGVYNEWHGFTHGTRLSGHVGTATGLPPYDIRWNTSQVPDQPEGSVRLIARAQGTDSVWHTTDVVEGLTLRRESDSVRLFAPADVPERFWVRAGRRASCVIPVPDEIDVSRVTLATVHLRTWNGYNERFRVNDYETDIGSENHNYAHTTHAVPTSAIRNGDNVIEFFSDTQHHGVEILYPGPMLTLRLMT